MLTKWQLSERFRTPGWQLLVRTGRVVLGFLLLIVGLVLLVLPGPGWLTIFFALTVLAADFAWAAWLIHQMKKQETRLRDLWKIWRVGRSEKSQNSKV